MLMIVVDGSWQKRRTNAYTISNIEDASGFRVPMILAGRPRKGSGGSVRWRWVWFTEARVLSG